MKNLFTSKRVWPYIVCAFVVLAMYWTVVFLLPLEGPVAFILTTAGGIGLGYGSGLLSANLYKYFNNKFHVGDIVIINDPLFKMAYDSTEAVVTEVSWPTKNYENLYAVSFDGFQSVFLESELELK
jgi:hypothetical protein